ncbi:MAG: hypothetical protein ACJZ9F_11860 [Rhodospirillaceae bacterium]
MPEKKPRKRSESLAIENVKRIADVLRSERNDSLALAQLKRQESDTLREQLLRTKSVLNQIKSSLDGEVLDQAEKCLNEIDETLSNSN